MYVAPQSRQERAAVLMSAIREIKLATLVTATPEGYHASHVPTVLKEEPDGPVLELHVARANPHWRAAADRPVSLAVFQGPHAYVSPSWYETKRQHGKVVPTWNYIAVHAQGRLEVVADEAWLHDHLDELTRANEAHRAEPWAVSDAPAEYIQNLSRAIVGLRFRIARLEGAWKMAQHRSEGDRLGVIAGLAREGGAGPEGVADAMRRLERDRGGPESR